MFLQYKSIRRRRKNYCLSWNKKEIFWRQRAKQMWLHSGDKNTKYFHATATTRRRTNQVVQLKNSEGRWIEWEEGLAEHIIEQFVHLFTATQSSWKEVVDCVETKISEDQNAQLLQ